MSGVGALGITVVSASAGSGKTYRLTKVVSAAIDPSGVEHIGLESLVAVTYTRKAHAELTARIRRTLVSAGAFDEALRLPLAYLGTVHAACLRLLQEFASRLYNWLSPVKQRMDGIAWEQLPSLTKQ